MEIVKEFATHLKEQGEADKTIESYTGDVTGFVTFLTDKEITFNGQFNPFLIHRYKNHLLTNNYEPTTINKKINSLQSFNQYLIESGTMTEKVIDLGRDRIKIAKGSEKPVEVYSDDVIDTLLFHLETKEKAIRDKVIIQLLLYTGVRVSELCNIKIKDIDFLAHQLKVIGKGGKYREIPLKVEVVDNIKTYLIERRTNITNHKVNS